MIILSRLDRIYFKPNWRSNLFCFIDQAKSCFLIILYSNFESSPVTVHKHKFVIHFHRSVYCSSSPTVRNPVDKRLEKMIQDIFHQNCFTNFISHIFLIVSFIKSYIQSVLYLNQVKYDLLFMVESRWVNFSVDFNCCLIVNCLELNIKSQNRFFDCWFSKLKVDCVRIND